MIHHLHLAFFASLLLFLTNGCRAVTFTVLDTRENPVPGAHIKTTNRGGPEVIRTDQDGKAVINADFGASLMATVYREGYYTSSGYLWRGGLISDGAGGLRKREMPDSFTVTLKKMRNPVPMRHRKYYDLAPVHSDPVGFDLHAMDWVIPHGMGTVSDFFVEFLPPADDNAPKNGRIRITFPNPSDGIQMFEAPRAFTSVKFSSNLTPPHQAPLQGYQNPLTQVGNLFRGGGRGGYNRHYILRTRTRTDASGRIVKACYAWIEGGFRFYLGRNGPPQLAFNYFFNPDPDPDARSLEAYRLAKIDRERRPETID